MGNAQTVQVTLEKVADALRTEGQIAGQISQAVNQAKQNVAAADKLEKEALEALARCGIGEPSQLLAGDVIHALAKGCRENATACAKAAETQMPILKQHQKMSQALMDALKPAIQGKRGADFGRRVVAAVKAFTG